MVDIRTIISNLKNIGYSEYTPELWNVHCMFPPENKDTVLVLCDNTRNFLLGKGNVSELRKILQNDPHLPPGACYLFAILNRWNDRKLLGRDILVINEHSYKVKSGNISKECRSAAEDLSKVVADNSKKCLRQRYKHDMFLENYRPIVSYLAVVLTIVLYFITKDNKMAYAISKEGLERGQYYRLFTYMVTHGNILHLAGNMISLFVCGPILERKVGALKFMFLYLLSGIYGAVASMYLGARFSTTVGASGAIFGVLGAILAKELFTSVYKRSVPVSGLVKTVVILFISGLFSPGTDNLCHMGGLAAGFLFETLFVVCDNVEYRFNHLLVQKYVLRKRHIRG